VASIARDVVV